MVASLRALGLTALVLASVSVQAESWRDYKCYLIDTEQQSRLHFFLFQPDRKVSQQRGLVGKAVKDSFGSVEAIIAEVVECVPIYGRFVNREARELDAKTPH